MSNQMPSSSPQPPLPVSVPNVPVMPPPPAGGMPWTESKTKKEGFDFAGFLHSLRRRYLLGLGLGCLLASVVALLVWILVPITHEAQVIIRIRRPENVSSINNNRPKMTATDFEMFKQTQVDLIKSQFVLNQALNYAGISSLPIVVNKTWGGTRDELEKYEWLSRKLRVHAQEGTEIVLLTLRDRDPEQVKQVLDAVERAYMKMVVDEERLRQTETKQRLVNRIRNIRDEIKDKTQLRIDIARRTGSADLEENNNQLSLARERLRNISSQRQRAELERDDLQMKLTEVGFRIQEARRYKPSPTQIKLALRRLDLEYMLLEQELTDLKLRAGTSGAVGGGFQSQISQLEAQMQQIEATKKKQVLEILNQERGNDPQDLRGLQTLLQTQYRFAAQKAEKLNKEYNDLEREISLRNQANSDLQVLGLEITSLAKIEEKLSQDIEGIDLALSQNDGIQVVQHAAVPASSSWMLNLLQITGSWLLTLAGTMAAIAFWDLMSKRVNTAKDVVDEGEIRVIGSLPMLNGRRIGGLLPMSSGMRRAVEIGLSRSIDSIRTALLYSKRKQPIEVVLITSALGQEGKTTTASQLAVSVARSGRRVLLIDADVRNPQQHVVLGLPFQAGLCEVLRGEADLEDVVRATPAEGLWFLPAGHRDPHIDQYMASSKVNEMMEELRSRFDMIIIDSGPVLTSPDAMLIGQYADVAVLAVRRDVSRLPKVREAADRLRTVGIEIVGAVVNGMNVDLRSSEFQANSTPPSEDPKIEAAGVAAESADTSFKLDDDDEGGVSTTTGDDSNE